MAEQPRDVSADTDQETIEREALEQVIEAGGVAGQPVAEGLAPAEERPLEVVQRAAATAGPLDVVQEAAEESFPASDSPTYTSDRSRRGQRGGA